MGAGIVRGSSSSPPNCGRELLRLRRIRWRLATLLAFLGGLAIIVAMEREPLFRELGSLWIVSDPATHSDAIVVLGGNFHVRPQVAAELFRRGIAERILISRTGDEQRAPRVGIPTDAELNRAALLKLGVPASAIESFGVASANTRDEAVALRDWAGRHGAAKIIIPSEIFSARRVRWIFRREFSGTAVEIAVPAFDPPGYSRDDWWKSENGVFALQSEILKYVYYRFKY